MLRLRYSSILMVFLFCAYSPTQAQVLEINETNSNDLFRGSWLVMFHASWCPSCAALIEPWEKLSSDLGSGEDLQLAMVDVSKNPGLNGQFLIFNLPSIYRLDDGVCRRYLGQHNPDALRLWVEEGTWATAGPIPGWKSPNSILLRAVGHFFRFASSLRDLKDQMIMEYGLPFWMAYAVLLIATIIIGIMVGLMVICILDTISAPFSSKQLDTSSKTDDTQSDDDQSTGDKKKKSKEPPKSKGDQQQTATGGGNGNHTSPRKRKKSKKAK